MTVSVLPRIKKPWDKMITDYLGITVFIMRSTLKFGLGINIFFPFWERKNALLAWEILVNQTQKNLKRFLFFFIFRMWEIVRYQAILDCKRNLLLLALVIIHHELELSHFFLLFHYLWYILIIVFILTFDLIMTWCSVETSWTFIVFLWTSRIF